jgi:hypothetical protein
MLSEAIKLNQLQTRKRYPDQLIGQTAWDLPPDMALAVTVHLLQPVGNS